MRGSRSKLSRSITAPGCATTATAGRSIRSADWCSPSPDGCRGAARSSCTRAVLNSRCSMPIRGGSSGCGSAVRRSRAMRKASWVPETSALRAQPGARMGTPLCRIALELAALQGWRRYGAAFLLGALLAAALPPVDLTPLVFIVFPLYLWLDDGSATPWASAKLAYFFALGHFAAGFYWIAAALFVDIAKFWWALPFVVLGVPALLSVFVAACLYAAALAKARLRLPGVARACLFAVAWGVAEWLRGHLFTGFPWNLTGYVWAGGFPGALAMLQSAAWVGIYGVGFVTVLAASLLSLLGTPSLAPLAPLRRSAPAIAAALLILVPAAAGAIRLHLTPVAETGIWLRLVQPSIAETMKWDPAAAEANFHRLIELSSAPSDHKLAAVIWPEAATPFFLERDEEHRAAIAARCSSSRSRKKGVAASGQITAASLWSDGAELSSIRRWKLASAAAGSHFIVSAIDGCTSRSQMPVSATGVKCSRIAPAAAGTRIRSAAAIAGAERRSGASGANDGVPSSESSDAASTVTKPTP